VIKSNEIVIRSLKALIPGVSGCELQSEKKMHLKEFKSVLYSEYTSF